MSSTEKFSFNSIKNFDEHIAKSIPNYQLLHEAIISLVPYFLTPNDAVIDLGCSTGKLLEAIPFDGRKIGYDTSPNLLPSSHGLTTFALNDITTIPSFVDASVVLSIFTLQFIKIPHRQELLDKIFSCLTEGGAFFWAEKIYADDAYWEHLLTSAHHDFKRKFFSAEEILNKEQDLRTLMRLQTSDVTKEMAWDAGFRCSALIWKFFNFECHVFVKGD